MELSHTDGAGKAKMVDVSGKPKVRRTARAEGRITMSPETVELIKNNLVRKGDVLAVANIAGIQGAKRTPELIPLCHGIGVDHVEVSFDMAEDGVLIESRAVCTDKTGIEMEALTAVSIAALAVYDMCKGVDKSMEIRGIRLIEKTKEEV